MYVGIFDLFVFGLGCTLQQLFNIDELNIRPAGNGSVKLCMYVYGIDIDCDY
jgi:hypothetical protein